MTTLHAKHVKSSMKRNMKMAWATRLKDGASGATFCCALGVCAFRPSSVHTNGGSTGLGQGCLMVQTRIVLPVGCCHSQCRLELLLWLIC